MRIDFTLFGMSLSIPVFLKSSSLLTNEFEHTPSEKKREQGGSFFRILPI